MVFPKFRGAAIKDQERAWVDDPYYASCYHKAGRMIARIAHFLLLKKGHSKTEAHITQDDLVGCAAGKMTKWRSPRP